jgi:hypothetical protein
MKVIFILSCPAFVWKDMKEYGSFKFGQRTIVPDDIGNLLIRQGLAQKIN